MIYTIYRGVYYSFKTEYEIFVNNKIFKDFGGFFSKKKNFSRRHATFFGVICHSQTQSHPSLRVSYSILKAENEWGSLILCTSQLLNHQKLSSYKECKGCSVVQVIKYISSLKNLAHETRIQVIHGFPYLYQPLL